MLSVAVLFLPGGCASAALLPVEIFRRAGLLWSRLDGHAPERGFRVATATPGGIPATGDQLISLAPSCALEDLPRPDIVVVPGGGWSPEGAAGGSRSVMEGAAEGYAAIVPWLRQWAAEGATIAGLGPGVALLAEAGLLDGRPAAIHERLANACRLRFPAVDWHPDLAMTDAGPVLCGAGIDAGAELSLHLVERFGGRDLALECARALLLDRPRPWSLTIAGTGLAKEHGDLTIRRAQDWIDGHFRRPLGVEALAAQIGLSPRTFLRRFKDATGRTPLTYIHAMRVDLAKQLLENGRETVQEVSRAVGYDDVIFFRDLFKRHTGMCPTAYRSRFRPPRPLPARRPPPAGRGESA